MNVYEGNADPSLKGAKPLAFISDLKVNTDGTRISYKVDDPRAKNGAINNILNAMHKGHTIAEFEDLAKNDWQPLPKTWQVLLNNVIEKDKKTGKPCVGANNFLVSLARMLARGFERVALYLLKPFQRDLKNHRAEIIDIRERLDRVEKKIGIGK